MTTRPTIYLVDNDPRIRKSLRSLLQVSGFHVEAAGSAEEFLARFDASKPGCILCDMAMPGLNGLALLRTLKRRGVDYPLIFLTGRGSISNSVQALKEGADDYFTKPVRAAPLLRAVRVALEREAGSRDLKTRLHSLTNREREVLKGAAEGRLNKHMAAELGVTERTIKFHRTNLMRKIEVRSAATMTQFAIEAGLVKKGDRGHAREKSP